MKVKNVVFSGFMAAILMGVGAADAAVAQIVSKDFADAHYADATEFSELKSAVEDSVTGLDMRELSANKATAITGAEGDAGNTSYPTVNAVVSWTADQIQDVQFDPADIEDNTIDGSKIIDGTIGEEKLDSDLADKLNGKQDKNMGVGHENKIVVTNETGTITTADTITQAQVDGLETALDAAQLKGNMVTTATWEANGNKDDMYPSAAAVTAAIATVAGAADDKLDSNLTTADAAVITDASGNVVTGQIATGMIADGAVTTGQIANGAVTATKLGADVITTDVTTTTGNTAAAQAGAVATALATKANAAAVGDITALETTDKTSVVAAINEVVDNKATVIDDTNKGSNTFYPTNKAVAEYVAGVVTGEDFELTGSQIGAGAIGEEHLNEDLADKLNGKQDKLIGVDHAGDVLVVGADGNITNVDAIGIDQVTNLQTTLDAKANAADVYTKAETNEKILEVALRRPNNTCTADSLCVLSITPDGGLAWVNVTEPVGEIPETTPIDGDVAEAAM